MLNLRKARNYAALLLFSGFFVLMFKNLLELRSTQIHDNLTFSWIKVKFRWCGFLKIRKTGFSFHRTELKVQTKLFLVF